MEKLDNHSILLKIYQEQKEIKAQLRIIPEMQAQLKIIPEMQAQLKIIPEMQEQLKVIPEMQEQLKVIPEMQEQLKAIPEIKETIGEMQKEIRNISKTVARIEVEHGKKLAALFDAFTAHSEKLDRQDKRISICEKHIENHDDQIYYLKSKVQGL